MPGLVHEHSEELCNPGRLAFLQSQLVCTAYTEENLLSLAQKLRKLTGECKLHTVTRERKTHVDFHGLA